MSKTNRRQQVNGLIVGAFDIGHIFLKKKTNKQLNLYVATASKQGTLNNCTGSQSSTTSDNRVCWQQTALCWQQQNEEWEKKAL